MIGFARLGAFASFAGETTKHPFPDWRAAPSPGPKITAAQRNRGGIDAYGPRNALRASGDGWRGRPIVQHLFALALGFFLLANAALADPVTLRTRIEASGRAITMGDIFEGVPAAIAGRSVAPAPPAGQTASLSIPVLVAAASAAGLEWSAPDGMRDVRVVRPGGMRATLPAQNTGASADVAAEAGVRRGDTVTIIVQAPGVTLSSRARALEDGAVGQTIRFLNPASNRTVEASVTGPGAARAKLQ